MDVVIYARVSTGKQVENDLSIPDQMRQLREWCKAHHHRLVSEYVEAGATATDDRRPVFQQMIGDASLSPPPFEAIVVHTHPELSIFRRGSAVSPERRKISGQAGKCSGRTFA